MEEAEIELIEFGSQVAIIDDNYQDAQPIEDAFNNLNVGNQYFKVDYIQPKYPGHPLGNVKLVFLDLYYDEGYGADFNPYWCAEWLKHIVPEGRKYTLVVWSKDIRLTNILLQTIVEVGAPYPSVLDRKSKPDYLKDNIQDNIEKMLGELGIKLKEIEIDIHEFHGKILEIEDDAVLINCLINEDPKVFEIRRFDLLPFQDHIDLKIGNFVHIKITTKPGSRTIDFSNVQDNLSNKFTKPDEENFEDEETIDWLNPSK
ncbi:hypothetical protein [Ferruginibacter profundus]